MKFNTYLMIFNDLEMLINTLYMINAFSTLTLFNRWCTDISFEVI